MSKFKKQEQKKMMGISSIGEMLSNIELVPTTSNLDSKLNEVTTDFKKVTDDLEKMIKKEKLDRTKFLKVLAESQKLADKSLARISDDLKSTKYYTDLNIDTLRSMIIFTMDIMDLQNKIKVKKISKFLHCRKEHDFEAIEKCRGIGVIYKCRHCDTLHFELEDPNSNISSWKYNVTVAMPFDDVEEELN